MSAEGQLQVWWHRKGPKGDVVESQDVSSVMGARAVYRAAEREGYHAIRVMQKKRGRWMRVPNKTIGVGHTALAEEVTPIHTDP
jgi:hypothetical protein